MIAIPIILLILTIVSYMRFRYLVKRRRYRNASKYSFLMAVFGTLEVMVLLFFIWLARRK
jgi:hypothetical protein